MLEVAGLALGSPANGISGGDDVGTLHIAEHFVIPLSLGLREWPQTGDSPSTLVLRPAINSDALRCLQRLALAYHREYPPAQQTGTHDPGRIPAHEGRNHYSDNESE